MGVNDNRKSKIILVIILFIILLVGLTVCSVFLFTKFNSKREHETLVKIGAYQEDGFYYVDYGMYPKTRIDNNCDLLEKLNSLTETNSKGYYEYEGDEYLKEVNSKYNSSSADFITIIDWYKVEPIKWRIINITSKKITLISEYILDYKIFTGPDENGIDFTLTTWLNDDFYNNVFNENEKNNIVSSNKNKVWLLNLKDVIRKKYGLNSDESRITTPTDYAGSKEYDESLYCWWLSGYYVQEDGGLGFKAILGDPGDPDNLYGVRPGLIVKVEDSE